MNNITADNETNTTQQIPEYFIKILRGKLALRIDEISQVFPIKRTRIYEELKSGRLKGRKCGATTLVSAWALYVWSQGLPEYTPDTDNLIGDQQ